MRLVTDRPPYMMLDGELVPYPDAKVHLLSTAVKYGAIVFEGIRAYWNQSQQQLFLFRAHDHMSRLLESMSACRMDSRWQPRDLIDQLSSLIRANGDRENLHIRVQAFVDAPNGRLDSVGPVAVAMAAIPMGRYFQGEGLRVCVSSWTRICDKSMPPRIKAAANYHNSRLALLDAKAGGFDDAILLTGDGKVAEGPGYNIFLVRRGCLLTPPVTDSILEGITRDSLIQPGRRRLGFEVQERTIDRTELYVASEMFFCGSSAEITPIVAVDNRTVGGGQPGRISGQLREALIGVAQGDEQDEWCWRTPVY